MKKKILKHTNSGFTLIEVLVAMLLLTMAILTVNAAFKQFVDYQDKMTRYEKIYTTVLSLRNQLSVASLASGEETSGTLNGLDYKYTVTLVDQRENFNARQVFEQKEAVGGFELNLFDIVLVADGHTFEFFQARFRQR